MASLLQPLLDTVLDGCIKGFPPARPPLRLGDIGGQGWRLLAGDLDTPVALLKASALDANTRWMQEFLRRTGVSLSPHGKTTMAPQLFHRQLADGAWGLTLATPQQVRVAVQYGIRRILLANELVSESFIAWLRQALDGDPGLDVTCLVDSAAGVARLEAASSSARPLPVLLEIGIPDGRAGARDPESALAIARAVRAAAGLRLRGVECFEGIVMSADAAADHARVAAWLETVSAIARRLAAEGLFETDEVLLTAGGSAYFDLVAAHLAQVDVGRPARVLLRSGCALIHDAGHYARLLDRLTGRLPEPWRAPDVLRPALEIWGRVLSRPEPGLAILDVGKRDAGHDIDLPRPLFWARPRVHTRPRAVPAGWSVTTLYDQHARLALPPASELAVGDLVGCGISHPCTTFDKWQLLFVVDDTYRVTEAIRTFF